MKELSGDIKLSRVQQIWYLFFNALRGVWGYRVFLKTIFWSPRSIDSNTDSPGRQYINAFFAEMIPKLIEKKTISVLDIGCGTGYVRNILESLGYGGAYTGIDIYQDKKFSTSSEVFTVQFIQQPIESVVLEETFDLVISNTSFEHIANDEVAAQKAEQFSGTHGVQIHILPAFWALPIYLLHGYRQYTPARIKKIFSNDCATVYRFGGVATFFLYFFCITIPERLTAKMLFRKTKLYPVALRYAQQIDKHLPLMSILYAVVIKTTHEKR